MIQEFLSAVTKNQTVVNCLGLVNVRTSAGWSALHMAARNGHDSCVRTLVLKRYERFLSHLLCVLSTKVFITLRSCRPCR